MYYYFSLFDIVLKICFEVRNLRYDLRFNNFFQYCKVNQIWCEERKKIKNVWYLFFLKNSQKIC